MVLVKSLKNSFRKLEKEVKKTAELTLKLIKKNGSVALYLVDDLEIKRLNKIFRGKNKFTNVLSFCEPNFFPHPELSQKKECKFLGEIYLAPVYIKKHEEDISYLAIHGLLHLVGYTHEEESDKMRMERKEKIILSRVFNSHARNFNRP